MPAIKYRLSKEISLSGNRNKKEFLKEIYLLFGQDEKNKNDMIVHNILSLMVEKIASNNGIVTLKQIHRDKIDFIIDRKMRKIVDISKFKNNERLQKRVNLYYGDPKVVPKERVDERDFVYNTFVNYVANESYKSSSKYDLLKDFIEKEYKLNQTTSIEIVNLGPIAEDVRAHYFTTLFVHGVPPLLPDKYLSSALSNVAIDAKYSGGGRKRINLYVRNKNDENKTLIYIDSLFYGEHISGESHTTEKFVKFMKFFGLDYNLFFNVFGHSRINVNEPITQNLDIDNDDIKLLFRGLVPYGHYCDLRKRGNFKNFVVDRNYFHRAFNLIDATALYVPREYNPYVSIHLVTVDYYCAIRLCGSTRPEMYPSYMEISWELKSEKSSGEFFDVW